MSIEQYFFRVFLFYVTYVTPIVIQARNIPVRTFFIALKLVYLSKTALIDKSNNPLSKERSGSVVVF